MISKEKLIKLLNAFIDDTAKRTDHDPVMLGAMAGAFAGLIEEIESGRFDADESAELTQARAEIERLKKELNPLVLNVKENDCE